MVKSYQKSISFTSTDEEKLVQLSAMSKLTQSNVLRQLIRMAYAMEGGGWFLKQLSKLKDEDLEELRIMADMEKLKKALGNRIEAKPRVSRDDYWNGNTIEQTIAIAKTRWVDDYDN